MNWYLFTCRHCGCRVRRSRLGRLARLSPGALAFPIAYVDGQGNQRCCSATAVYRHSGWYDRSHAPEMWEGNDDS